EIAPRVRLAEQLRPNVLAVRDPRQETVLLVVGAVLLDRAGHQRVAEHVRDAAPAELLAQHTPLEAVDNPNTRAELVDDIPGVVQRPHPRAQLRDVFRIFGHAHANARLPVQLRTVLGD